MEYENMMWLGFVYFIVINIFGFFVMKIDKNRAIKGNWRTSEKFLLSVSIIGGALGMFIGMRQFRHKTNKLLFKIGLPVIILLQALIASLIINK